MKSNCAERPNYEINKSTREPRMPARPICQTAGTELHKYVLKPDRFKRPIMCTSIDEAQNPELGEAIQSDRQSRDSHGLKPVQLQMSHLSASQ